MDFVSCDSVNCGLYEAESCEKCMPDTITSGQVYVFKKHLPHRLCNGDCDWHPAEQICREKGMFQTFHTVKGGIYFRVHESLTLERSHISALFHRLRMHTTALTYKGC